MGDPSKFDLADPYYKQALVIRPAAAHLLVEWGLVDLDRTPDPVIEPFSVIPLVGSPSGCVGSFSRAPHLVLRGFELRILNLPLESC